MDSSKRDDSWLINDDKNAINDKDLVSLYKIYYDYRHESLKNHFNVRNYYTIILSALFGLFITSYKQLLEESSLTLFALGSIALSISVLSIIAIKSSSRYYQGFLQAVVFICKIENALGIDEKLKIKRKIPQRIVWKADRTFMIDRYIYDRFEHSTKDTSKEFIRSKLYKGDNLWATVTFGFFFLLGLFCLLLIAFPYLIPYFI